MGPGLVKERSLLKMQQRAQGGSWKMGSTRRGRRGGRVTKHTTDLEGALPS